MTILASVFGVLAVSLPFPASSGPGAVARQEEPAPTPSSSTRLERAQVEDLARATVCTISLRYPRKETRSNVEYLAVRRVQVGFIASASGLVVTSYAAIHAADSITVEFPGATAPSARLTADVVAIDEHHDLALLRVQRSPTAPAGADKAKPGVNDSAPSASDPVAAPATPRFLPTQAATAPFDAVTWTPIVSPDGKRLELVETADLLESDGAGFRVRAGPYESRLGGQPVIDESGRIAGVWCWGWPAVGAAPSWIDARTVHDLVTRHGGDAAIKRGERRGRAPRVSRTMPEILFDGRTKSSPMDDVTKRTNQLRDKTSCPSCRGRGWVLDAESTEIQRGVDIWKVDKSKRLVCRGCKGERLRDRGALWEEARMLAKWYAQLDPRNARDVDRALLQLEKGIGEAAETNAPRLIERLNDGAKEELHHANLIPGRALVFSIHRDEWLGASAPDWEQDARVLNTREFGTLLVVGPATRSVIGEGHRALVVGVVAGLLTIGEQDVVRLDGCFVVPVRETSDDPGR